MRHDQQKPAKKDRDYWGGLHIAATLLYAVLAVIFAILAIKEFNGASLEIWGKQLIQQDPSFGLTYVGLFVSCIAFSFAVASFAQTATEARGDRRLLGTLKEENSSLKTRVQSLERVVQDLRRR